MACTTTLATAGATTLTLAATSGVQAQAGTQGDDAVAYASRFAGVPYVYGGTTPSGFDCSGFTSYVYRHVGVELPRTSGAQYDAVPRVAQGDRLPGDLLFFFSGSRVSHVAIYAGNNEMWAAPSSGDVVKKQSVYTSSYAVGRPWSGAAAAPAMSPDNAAIMAHWNALGGARSPLGGQTSPYTRIGGGAFVDFATGGITSDGNGGNVRETHGDIRRKWGQTGWERGPLGFPVTDELKTADGVGRYNDFQRGGIVWSPTTGAHETHGDIRKKWGATGWERGVLGYPTTDELRNADGQGRYNNFQNGTVTWTPSTGAVATTGAIRSAWGTAGWERGRLGYPVADAVKISATVVEQRFQRGAIQHDVAVGRTKIIG